MTSIAIDVMGGDYAPKEPILGIIEALNTYENLEIYAVGDETLIKAELANQKFSSERLHIEHTTEKISTAESPVIAVSKKKKSSLVKTIKLVKDGTCECAISAGNSGAYMVAAQAYIKRIKGVMKPPLAPLIPTIKGPAILVDCGANVDVRPDHILTFAKLGSAYIENVCGIKNPRVAIVNIGAEEEKGNKLVKESFPLLKECKSINFIGSIEAREIISGYADVIVCDAFVGNVILKLLEGVLITGKSLLKKSIYSSIKSKIGGLLIKKSLKQALKDFDTSSYGGAPLLGLEGLVVKCHGNAKRKEFFNAITQSIEFSNKSINNIIKEKMEEM